MSTSTTSARPYHHPGLRAALIAEALRVLADTADASSLSLRDLARRLGVSHAAPYRHFANMEALLAAIAEEGFLRLTAAVEEAAGRFDGPAEQLTETGWAYVRFALDYPQYFRLMFGGRVSPSGNPRLQAAGQRAFEALLRIIEQGMVSKAFVGTDARELATTAWAEVHGLATLLLDGQLINTTSEDVEGRVRRASRILIAGLGQADLRHGQARPEHEP